MTVEFQIRSEAVSVYVKSEPWQLELNTIARRRKREECSDYQRPMLSYYEARQLELEEADHNFIVSLMKKPQNTLTRRNGRWIQSRMKGVKR
jgi:hypothetical protein